MGQIFLVTSACMAWCRHWPQNKWPGEACRVSQMHHKSGRKGYEPQCVTVRLVAESMQMMHSNELSLVLLSSFGAAINSSGILSSLVRSYSLGSSSSSTTKTSSESGITTERAPRNDLRDLEPGGRPDILALLL